eukprot:5341641-Pyramimonas_sp.AAC.1
MRIYPRFLRLIGPLMFPGRCVVSYLEAYFLRSPCLWSPASCARNQRSDWFPSRVYPPVPPPTGSRP